jgi:paraquat-inducible protein A
MHGGGPLIACPHCGTLHQRAPLARGARALCSCCHAELYRQGWLSAEQWYALAWASLIVFAWAQVFPIADISLQGLDLRVTFWGALREAWDRGYYGVSVLTGLAGFWLPLIRIVLTLRGLQIIFSRADPEGLAWPLRWLERLAPWAMASVLVLAILVAFVKLAGLAHVQAGPGLLGFFVLIFLLAGLSRWDAAALWRLAEDRGRVPVSGALGMGAVCDGCGLVQPPRGSERCRRCHGRLPHHVVQHRGEVWALVVAAAIFYIPANLLPVMRVQTLLGSTEHTILGGVVELWRMGSWDLSLIVFVASVMVPVTKLVALTFLLLHEHPVGVREQRRHTRLYDAIERVGQWSMLDVFVVVLLAAMANFRGFSQIFIGPAALNFGMVVVLTVAATLRYDPRRGWDSLREPMHD